MTVQLRHPSGAAHAVPLVAQAARGEGERIARIDGLGHAFVWRDFERCLAGGSGIDAVFVETRLANAFAFAQRPLLRTLCVERRVTHTSDVQVTSACGFAMFVEDGLHRLVGK